MKIPNTEYFKNLKDGYTPWTAIAMTVKDKKYPMEVIGTLFKKYMPAEDFTRDIKDTLLENLFAISHNLKYKKGVSENPLFYKDSENENALN